MCRDIYRYNFINLYLFFSFCVKFVSLYLENQSRAARGIKITFKKIAIFHRYNFHLAWTWSMLRPFPLSISTL